MLDIASLSDYFKLFQDLKMEDVSELFASTKERKLQASEIFIEAGSIKNRVAYIKKGLIRSYRTDSLGNETTLILRWENQFVGSHDMILFNRPSRFTYEAIEATVIQESDYGLLQQIISRNPKLEKYRTHFLQQTLRDALEQMESFVLLSPEERYLQLIKSKKDIVSRVPDKYIANIIGVTPQSLSRIRRRIAMPKR